MSTDLSTKEQLEPLHDWIFVRVEHNDEISPGGIVMPDIYRSTTERGFVVAVGPGKLDESGNYMSMAVAPGETILYHTPVSGEIKINGETLCMVQDRNVIAKVKKS